MIKLKATAALFAAGLGLFLLVSCRAQEPDNGTTDTPAATATPASSPGPAASGTTSNCLAPPFLAPNAAGKNGYDVPKDIALTRQADANCFAWQEFIALNWTASSQMRGQPDTSVPPSQFGDPRVQRDVVWETYKEADEVFLAGAQDPGKWNSWPSGTSVKVLGGMRSEVHPVPPLDLSDIGQASQGHPWLTAQSGILTLYERRMNEDEYNYIVHNQLYNADIQQTFVQNPGINLPDGTASSSAHPVGSIETKAAWLELPNPRDWPRYKISKAIVTYPNQQPKTVVVGLVGLHIIHKTALGQQFIWATFEHRENAPDRNRVASKALRPTYTYYNPACDPNTDYYNCVENANPAFVKNGPKNPYDAPIQVVRETPIPTRPNDNVVGLNEYVWDQIKAQNADSVFLHYELVNTLWSNQNTPITKGSHIPLIATQLSPAPNQEPVANTTLETYVQSLTCLSCHASAAIAQIDPVKTLKIFNPARAGTPETQQNPYASDYSFLLSSAQQPNNNKKQDR